MSAQVPAVVATLDRDLTGRESLLVLCPFCDRMHSHGAGAGLGFRMSHCLIGPRNYELVAAAPNRELHGCVR
jgi:hypothetical protein